MPTPRSAHVPLLRRILAACLLACLAPASRGADSWPRFRGPSGAGVATSDAPLPAELAPDRNVIWKVELPPGHSSPVVHGEHIVLTAVDGDELVTLGLARATGLVRWRAVAPYDEAETIHAIGSLAQSTSATDGERVVSFFGSAGLFCYDMDGKELWKRPLGPFKNTFGAGSSPIIAGGLVLLNQDHDIDSFLLALDPKTGRPAWKIERSEFPRGYATPMVQRAGGRTLVVIPGTLQAVAYDLETRERVWWANGLARIVNTSAVAAPDGTIFIATWSPGADQGDRIHAEPFDEVLAGQDANGNGLLERSEVKDDALSRRFDQIDRDKSEAVTRVEYDYMKNIFETAQNSVMAIAPGGTGDVTESHVRWRYDRNVPYVPTPLYHDGHLYLIKDGAIVTCLDAKTGELTKRGRLSWTGNCYSSPVYGDGKIYLFGQRGGFSAITGSPDWKELATADFGEDVYATPAIVGGRIYVRAGGHLYCFGSK